MEKNTYQILAELHDYVADPKRSMLNTTDREHVTVALSTLLTVYKDDLAPMQTVDAMQSGEARRPPTQLPKKPSWLRWFLG